MVASLAKKGGARQVTSWNDSITLVAVFLFLLGLPSLLLFLLLLLLALTFGTLFSGLTLVPLALLLIIVIIIVINIHLAIVDLWRSLLLRLCFFLGSSVNCWLCRAFFQCAVILVVRLPLGGSGLVGTSIFLKQRLELLLLQSNRSKTPSARVKIALHDATLDLGNNAMVTG
ncbi:hypothetical protein BJX66DRAFT_281476 [Aspergillus keveii]|uniref:Transmembrane protein n=1 Tax=Aspergillus keveii TaxID=714993 RepID=A0ABR4FWL5_9EURO